VPRSAVPTGKLTIPRPVGPRVRRTLLAERIEHSAQHLVLLVAPAGFGKTTTLAEWATSTAADVAWLSCDESDSEPSRFWSGLIAAVTSRWPQAGYDAALVLERRPDAQRQLVTSLGTDLAGLEQPGAIVIDDIQFAGSAQRMLPWLLAALPPQVRLVLGSRRDPAFSLARLRVSSGLLELRAEDLAFSPQEAAALLALAKVTLEAGDLGRLHALTEGWPAGLQLAAMALHQSGDHRRAIDAFASTTRAMSVYLVEEVLDQLPAEFADFITMIAVLDEFDAALCEAVTEDPDASGRLEELVSADLFVVQVGDTEERYRFHRLFQAFLRARLKALGEDLPRKVHERAIRALEERGDHLAALRLATVTGDTRRAAEIVTKNLLTSLNVSDSRVANVAVRAWLREYGANAVSSDPEQLLLFVAELAVSGRPEAEEWLTRLGHAHPDPAFPLRGLLHAVQMEQYLGRGHPEQALRHSQLAADAIREASGYHPVLAVLPALRVLAHMTAGDLPSARASLAEPSAPLDHPVLENLTLPALRAWTAFQEGELTTARRIAAQVLERVPEYGAHNSLGAILANLVEAAINIESGEFKTAEQLLSAAEAQAQANGRTVLQSLASRWQARLATARGDETAASAYLTEAKVVFRSPSPALRAEFALEELRQAIVFAPERAALLVPQLPDRLEATLLRARLAVAQGRLTLAAELTGALSGVGTVRERVESGVLRALAEFTRDPDAARASLRSALLLAQPEGFSRTILEQGTAVPGLLESFSHDGQLAIYADDLATMANRDMGVAPPRQSASATASARQLTAREVTVLRYLQSRLTNREIASALFVSENTLKTHLKSIYRKLDVSSRREATAAGHASGLI
jgi:LuxR family transcriptional regulator, maltose regulon positive regulatory protein